LKAADQVRAIRQLLMRKHEYSTPVYVGINALVAIGTDEAWAAIAEVASSAERSVRCEVMNAFQGKGGARTVALAAKVLDDPEPSVRLAAYWAVYHVEPKLFAGLPGTYSEDNVATLKTLLRDREPTTP
jgi:HEAT repeat protein